MTDHELRELRELLVDKAEQDGFLFQVPPRIWELVGLPEKAISQLRNEAASYSRDASAQMTHDQDVSDESCQLVARSDVLNAEANLIEARSRLRKLDDSISNANYHTALSGESPTAPWSGKACGRD